MGEPSTSFDAKEQPHSGATPNVARVRDSNPTSLQPSQLSAQHSVSSSSSDRDRAPGRVAIESASRAESVSDRKASSPQADDIDIEKGLASQNVAKQDGASPVHNTDSPQEKSASVTDAKKKDKPKLPFNQRAKRGTIRFWMHTKHALTHTWLNLLLVFVPIGIAAEAAHLSPAIVFAMNSVAIIPLAGMLTLATESVASRLGDTWGALLNVSFGNAVELIIFIIALVKNEIRVVQAALLGSILANLLLILGMAFLIGGLRYREQIYNSTVTQLSACLLSLSVMSLLLPTAFHASFEDNDLADRITLKISRGTSIILLCVYGLYLLFQLKSHSYLYQSMPQEQIDEETEPAFLHEMFETSSSSSSDSSSSSSSDSDTNSFKARRRIRRAFRKRRKSSATSSRKAYDDDIRTIDEVSAPSSLINVESVNTATSASANGKTKHDYHHVSKPSGFRDETKNGNNAAISRAAGVPQVRDFERSAETLSLHGNDRLSVDESGIQTPKLSSRQKRKLRKEERRRQRKKRSEHYRAQTLTEEEVATVHQAGFHAEGQADGSDLTGTNVDRPATKGRVSFLRPGLPKLFSENVFVQPAQQSELKHLPSQTQQTRLYPVRVPSLDRLHHSSSHHQKNVGARPTIRKATSTPNINSAKPNDYEYIPTIQGRGLQPSMLPLPPPKRRTTDPDGDENADDDDLHNPEMSRVAAVVLLLASTGLVALCAEFLVSAIPDMVANSSVSQAFIGLIILPIVGNAAEHATAVTVAAKNKMDLAIGVALGSSIQIALFITPIVIIIGWAMDRSMSLYFSLFETVSLFVTAFVVNFLVLDGRSNYLEGTLLIAVYVIISIAAFFYPNNNDASDLGGTERNATQALVQPVVNAAMQLMFKA